MTNKSIVVAGHICVDMIPDMSACKGPLDKVIVPGKLVNVGAPLMSTGGVVANTGLALHKLGLPVKLLGKVGDDSFGQIICQIVGANSPQLSRDMIISRGESTSYSVVISVPGCDRAFLHYPGTNNTFCADDINYESLEGVSLFHFGYPPLMRKMFLNNGAELAQMFGKVKAMGITTSMDMTLPDPDSESGRVDWASLLAEVLPHVDIFVPSLDEIVYMLAPDRMEEGVSVQLLRDISEAIFELGSAVTMIKLGDRGIYAGATSREERLADVSLIQSSDDWCGREIYRPCFMANLVGTTGSGDCTIAGFLGGLTHEMNIEECATMAVAVGAFSVEAADATGGIKPWAKVLERINAGWETHLPAPQLEELM